MAIKIRCVDCKKKISIDEAFAGGVCRCPYCTAIVYVPDDAGAKKGKKGRPQPPGRRPAAPGARPQAPSRPTRPDAPVSNVSTADISGSVDTMAETTIDTPPPGTTKKPAPSRPRPDSDEALAKAHGQMNIPAAAPVKLQGIVALVLIVLMLGMFAGVVVLGINRGWFKGQEVQDVTPENYNKTSVTVRDVPAVAGTIEVTAPVVYCIDTSKQMANMFEPAGKIVLASIKSLKKDGAFNIILVGEDSDKTLSDQPIPADKAGLEKARAFLALEICNFAEQGRAIETAMNKMNAKTVVLLARDSITGVEDQVKNAFKGKSAKLHTVVLGGKSKGLKKLAESTGGKSRAFTKQDLIDQIKRAEQQ